MGDSENNTGDSKPDCPSSVRVASRKIPWSMLVLLVIVALVLATVLAVERGMGELHSDAKAIAAQIDARFQLTPNVYDHDVLVIKQETPIIQVASYQFTDSYEKRWVHSWLMSEKWVHVKAIIEVKAGYDLTNQSFDVQISGTDGGNRYVTVALPKPVILSVEIQPNMEVQSENGWWNRISDQERSAVLNKFLTDARTENESRTEILGAAQKQLRNGLHEIIHSTLGPGVEVVFVDQLATGEG